jgi:hypothetical protein
VAAARKLFGGRQKNYLAAARFYVAAARKLFGGRQKNYLAAAR